MRRKPLLVTESLTRAGTRAGMRAGMMASLARRMRQRLGRRRRWLDDCDGDWDDGVAGTMGATQIGTTAAASDGELDGWFESCR